MQSEIKLPFPNIKAIEEILTIEEIIFYTILGFIVLLIGVIVWFFIFKKRKRRKLTKKELALIKLKEIDFNNTKKAVYTFSVNAKMLASKEQEKKLDLILKRLQKYKYKKEVPKLDIKDISNIKNFIKELKI